MAITDILESIQDNIPMIAIVLIGTALVVGGVYLYTKQVPPIHVILIGIVVGAWIGYGTRNTGKPAKWDFVGGMTGRKRRY